MPVATSAAGSGVGGLPQRLPHQVAGGVRAGGAGGPGLGVQGPQGGVDQALVEVGGGGGPARAPAWSSWGPPPVGDHGVPARSIAQRVTGESPCPVVTVTAS